MNSEVEILNNLDEYICCQGLRWSLVCTSLANFLLNRVCAVKEQAHWLLNLPKFYLTGCKINSSKIRIFPHSSLVLTKGNAEGDPCTMAALREDFIVY